MTLKLERMTLLRVVLLCSTDYWCLIILSAARFETNSSTCTPDVFVVTPLTIPNSTTANPSVSFTRYGPLMKSISIWSGVTTRIQ